MSEATKRRRVPISCLNCRRRKVKCDKIKPICGGCVRNGVADSCEYLDPHWINNDDNNKKDVPKDNKSTELEELKQAKSHNEKLIASQRKEIDDLKRQLSFTNQLNTDHKESSSSSHYTIDILKKLKASDNSSVEVDKLIYLSLVPGQNQKLTIRSIYSWLSIIRIDPKLTSLWSKIGNMQKIYHSFKIRRDLNDSNKCPVSSIHLKDELNEWHKSPVPPSLKKTSSNYSPDGFHLMILMQKVFKACAEVTGKSLTFEQYNFLLDYYFQSPETSSRLTGFFKDELRQSVQMRDGNYIQLAISASREMNGLRYEMHLEETKAILTLLAMLLIVLEESLVSLAENARNGLVNAEMVKFKELFPEVDLTINKMPDSSLNLVQDVILNCIEDKDGKVIDSLSMIACMMLLINADISDHSRDSYKDFNIKNLFDTFFNQESQLAFWRDPSGIVMSNSGKKKSKDVKIYMTRLWNELLRIMNLVCFSIVPIDFSKEFDNNLRFILNFIEQECDTHHIDYIVSLKNNDLESLVSSLKINTSLIKAHIHLQRGIEHSMGPKLTIKDLDILSSEISSWTTDATIKNLPSNLRVEFRIMVHLSSAYLMFVMFIQSEQLKDLELRDHISLGVLNKMSTCVKATNVLVDSLTEEKSQYLLFGIVEQFTLSIQIIVAILLRILNRKDKVPQDELYKKLAASCNVCGNLKGKNDVKDLFREQIMNYIDSLLSKLDVNMVEKNHIKQLITLWNFYKSLINSVEKFDINYNKFHHHVPGFKNVDGDFNKCPISHVEPGKCPIDHSKFSKKPNKPTDTPSTQTDNSTSQNTPDVVNGLDIKDTELAMSFDFNFDTMIDLLPTESSAFSAMNFDFLRDSSFFDLTPTLNLDFLDEDNVT